MFGYTKLDNLSTQFFMIQITCGIYCWHPCMFACCVCGNHALCKPGTNAGAACLCLPVDVLDRSCVMVAYPVIHHWVSEDSLLYRQYYISTNFSNYKDTVLNLTPLSRCCMLKRCTCDQPAMHQTRSFVAAVPSAWGDNSHLKTKDLAAKVRGPKRVFSAF